MKKQKSFWKISLLIFMAAFLISCGGGGGGGSSSSGGSGGGGGGDDGGGDTPISAETSLSGTVYTSSSSGGGGVLQSVATSSVRAAAEESDKIPVSGANILIFDVDSASTAAKATATTDSDGEWSVEIDPGNYIIFAVYLDLSNLTLKVDRVDDVTAEEGESVAVEDQVVISDETAPTILSILDDTIADTDSDGQDIYEPSSIPSSSKIAIYFNESMSRTSVEDALDLEDTNGDVGFSVESNGSLTEFRIIPTAPLTSGATYTLTIAETAKDMANNQLGVTVVATIDVMTDEEASQPFSLLYTKPKDSAADVPISAAISMTFNYPADFSSFKSNLTITPALEGRIEIMGKTATFFPTGTLSPETLYSVVIGSGVKDLTGNTLDSDYSFSFTAGQPLIASEDPDSLAVAAIVGKFQAAMESGNFSSILPLLTPDFEAEEWDHETGMIERMDAAQFVEFLSEVTSKQMGFGDIERILVQNTSDTDNRVLVEHYKNSSGYDLYRGFEPIEWAEFDDSGNVIRGDIIDVEKEVTDQWSGENWIEHMTYLLAGGRFDSGNCATGEATASIPKFDDEFGRMLVDETTGEPEMMTVQFTAVDGDCDATNSWEDANDSDPGNNPWPQDGDTDPGNDPIPHNDSNLEESLRDKVVSSDELWSSSESYYVVDSNGEWQGVVNTDLRLTEITGPLGWPCTRFVDSMFGGAEVIDNNADGECDGDNDSGYDLTRVFVDEDGNDITSVEVLFDYWDQMRPVPFRFEVLSAGLSVPEGERFDLEPDWWVMDDDDGDGKVDEDPIDGTDNDGDGFVDEDGMGGGAHFDPNRWTEVLEETSDAVMEIYYLTMMVDMSIDPSSISFFPLDFPDKASVFVEIEITEEWSPHPPFDPEHPETADLNGDGKIDEQDNNFIHYEHRDFKFEKIAGEWLLSRISMGGAGGPGEFEIFGLQIIPVEPAPVFDPSGMPAGPPENVGTTPTFEWSFEEFPSDVTVGSVVIYVMEMGVPTSTRPSEPVKARILLFPDSPTQYTYGSGEGDDITALVIQEFGSDPEEDFPISDPAALIPAGALEDAKVYIWGVMAFEETQTEVKADLIGESDIEVDPVGESFEVLFATDTMPAGFDEPLSAESLKVRVR